MSVEPPERRTVRLPAARVRPIRRRSWAWILPLLAAALAVHLGTRAWGTRGAGLLLHARDGYGLKAGDLLLYRGIAAGEVTHVELAGDLRSVELRIRLDPAAEELARAGSRFWIERADIALDRLRGVETILGSRYLSVVPGSPTAPRQLEFVCLDEPPVLTSPDEDSLEFVLEAPRRFGLSPGAPITYRQIEVGSVVAVGLATDAGSVEVRCVVRGPFTQLVREDTRFWESGGLELSLELLDGFRLSVDSLRSLLVGGVSLATPTRPGSPARTGQRFPLHAGPEEEWLAWSPALPVGTALLPSGTPTPRLLRARLVWEEGFFGAKRARSGWVLPTTGGVVGPVDLLVPPADAEEPALELEGERFGLASAEATVAGRVARRDLGETRGSRWPADRIREPRLGEDFLVVTDPRTAPTALASARLSEVEGGWQVDAAIAFDESWHGAVVLAREDGALVGLLEVHEGCGVVVPLTGL